MSMNTRTRCASTSSCSCGIRSSVASDPGAHVRLRGRRGSRGEGDPRDRQAVLRGARAATTTSWSSMPRPPAHRRSGGAPRVISELVQVGLVKDADQSGCSTSSKTRPRTGLVTVTTPEEMPVNETIDLLDQVAEAHQGGQCCHCRQTVSCRRCSAHPRGAGLRSALHPSGEGAARQSSRAQGGSMSWTQHG